MLRSESLPKSLHCDVIVDVEKMKTAPRDAAFVQTMNPPRKIDHETMSDLVHMHEIQSQVIADVAQPEAPPRKIDHESMGEFVHSHEIQSEVIADVARPETPPKSLHSNVIVDVQKMKTPPRDAAFV